MIKIVRKIPGFRSGVWWKMIIASGAYLFGLLIVVAIVSPSAPTLTVDKVSPTNKSFLSISGKTLNDKQVYLLQNNQEIQSIRSDSGGKFYFALNDLKDGNYTYTVQSCASEKKDKCTTENVLISVDQAPPVKPSIALPADLPDDSEETITIRGIAELNSKVIVKANGNDTVQETYANDKGEFEVQSGLAIGGNTFTIKSVDNVGNESEPVTSSIDFNPTKYKAKVARAIDGDTIKLETGEVVRYIGIDTPETVHPSKPVQCYGKEASDKNRELVEGKEVKLEKDISETDKYNRLLRYIWLGDALINESLVREGYAHSSTYPPDVKHQDKFIEAERQAREEKKGLWGDVCNSISLESTRKPAQAQTTTPSQNIQPVTTVPTKSVIQPTQPSSGGYSCNCSKTCGQMSSCAEAQYQLNICGCNARDADHDGIACDSDCQ